MKNRTVAVFISAALLMAMVGVCSAAAQHSGKVIETMNSGGYTYAKVEENGDTYWVAGQQSNIAVGEEVHFTEQMWMQNFHSKSLDRTFDKVLFVTTIEGDASSPAHAATPHPAPVATEVAALKSASISKPEGAYTIADLYAQKEALNGKTVQVRGEVVKISRNILDRTWVHIKDGSGTKGSDKVVFRSTSDTVVVGDVVTAEGRLEVDKDFGMGYLYPVIVEDATFTK
ncbi:MAG: DNA-binding protein [Gammaproteobacteria bacterium]|nr:DNA-binding protein [Gammaproteobacteria bacterium]